MAGGVKGSRGGPAELSYERAPWRFFSARATVGCGDEVMRCFEDIMSSGIIRGSKENLDCGVRYSAQAQIYQDKHADAAGTAGIISGMPQTDMLKAVAPLSPCSVLRTFKNFQEVQHTQLHSQHICNALSAPNPPTLFAGGCTRGHAAACRQPTHTCAPHQVSAPNPTTTFSGGYTRGHAAARRQPACSTSVGSLCDDT